MRISRDSEAPELLSDLVRRSQNLDGDALDALVDHYASRLYGFLFRLTGNRDDADDLVQETFIRLVRNISSYREDGRFEAWLFRIATNLARDRVRRARCSPIAGSIDEDENHENSFQKVVGIGSQTTDSGPMEPVLRLETGDRLQEAVSRLPQAEREVVMLRYYGDFSFADIADMMETPLGTALARAHRGLAKLRQWMEASE